MRSLAQSGSGAAESADSNVLAVPAKDVFPPAAPQTLVAVFVPAEAGAAAYVELTWSINTEPDLAGYAVYRSEQEEAPGERLNPELLPVPAFRDLSIVVGQRYYYHVRAVDRAGNESSPSAAVGVNVP